MSGETGQLQKLTDQQVSARLAAYNPGGQLDLDLQLLRDNVADLLSEEILAQFGPERAERYAQILAGQVDSSWIQGIAGYGREIYQNKTSVPVYIAARTQTAARIVSRIADRFANDPAKLKECTGAFLRLSTFETDIILAQVALLEAIEASEGRGR
jgi:methyl-accepting chemotaxis protein